MRVLIVEDDKSSREFLKYSIESKGHEVDVAENGMSGLESFKKFKPQVVFSDILMPKMNGLELLEKIRKSDQQTIVVMNTAFGCEEYAIQALRLNANNYLNKPIRHAELFPLLDKYKAIIEVEQVAATPVEPAKKTYSIEIPNQLDCVAEVVNRLVLEVNGKLNKDQVLDVKLGLCELIRNAIMHGNLGIRYRDSLTLFEYGMDLDKLCQEELKQNPKLAERKVRVEFKLLDDRCEWTITDEGPGFDWRKTLWKIDQAKLNIECKGIFISKFHFSKLEYNESGNSATATKFLEGK